MQKWQYLQVHNRISILRITLNNPKSHYNLLYQYNIFKGNYADAETILLQAGLTFRAILMNIHLHQWEKALDLSIKHKTHVDTVLAYRIKHLQRCDAEETIDKYNAYMKEVEVDWENVAQKVEAEFQKERERK